MESLHLWLPDRQTYCLFRLILRRKNAAHARHTSTPKCIPWAGAWQTRQAASVSWNITKKLKFYLFFFFAVGQHKQMHPQSSNIDVYRYNETYLWLTYEQLLTTIIVIMKILLIIVIAIIIIITVVK